MRNFDCFVGIDWSGAKSPVNNQSISVSIIRQNDKAPKLIQNSNENWSREKVAHWIINLVKTKAKERILIGIDCNFGYASSVIKSQFGQGATYKNLWHEVDEACYEAPNFFAQGFWTHPEYKKYFWAQGKKLDSFDMPKRQTEVLCAQSGCGNPESPFKLIGAKQVGKGGLAGMRMAQFLKAELGDKIAFWPFEMDLVDKASIVVTEIYPRQFLMRAGHGVTKIRNIEDLNKALSYLGAGHYASGQDLSDHDTDSLSSAAGLRYLCGAQENVPKGISHPEIMSYNAKVCEGWIFGITG